MSKNKILDFILTIVYAVIFTVIVRTLLYDPYHIPSSSMTPILRTGDKIFVSKFLYGYSKYSIPFHPINFEGRIASHRSPSRGEIVVFTLPKDENTFYIKRIIGLPGDKIETKNSHVYVNDKLLEYSFVRDIPAYTDENENSFSVSEYIELNQDGKYYSVFLTATDYTPQKTYIVPEGSYFLMGDNRSNSGDSRFDSMGFIPFENIIGRAEMVFFSTQIGAGILPEGIRLNRIFNMLKPQILQLVMPKNTLEIINPNEIKVQNA